MVSFVIFIFLCISIYIICMYVGGCGWSKAILFVWHAGRVASASVTFARDLVKFAFSGRVQAARRRVVISERAFFSGRHARAEIDAFAGEFPSGNRSGAHSCTAAFSLFLFRALVLCENTKNTNACSIIALHLLHRALLKVRCLNRARDQTRRKNVCVCTHRKLGKLCGVCLVHTRQEVCSA